MLKDQKVVICGGGGFIGGHLIGDLLRKGHTDVRSVDIKPFGEWYQKSPKVENVRLDLNGKDACEKACRGAGLVYNPGERVFGASTPLYVLLLALFPAFRSVGFSPEERRAFLGRSVPRFSRLHFPSTVPSTLLVYPANVTPTSGGAYGPDPTTNAKNVKMTTAAPISATVT